MFGNCLGDQGTRSMQSIPAADPGQAPTLLAEDAGDTGRILLGVFETLERAGLRYCVLHGYENYPQRIKSDVDCVVSDELSPPQLVALLRENRDRLGAEVIGAGAVRRQGYYVVLAGKN